MDVSSSRIRIDRAEASLRQAEATVEVWLRDGFEWVFYSEPTEAWDCWALVVTRPIPTDFFTDVGDFCGHARSALDYLASAEYGARNPGQSASKRDRPYFPIVEPGVKWENTSKMIRNASPEFLEMARLSQDVPPGNLLYMLNEFSNAYKHRGLYLAAISPHGESTGILPAIPAGFSEGSFTMGGPSEPIPFREVGHPVAVVEYMLTLSGSNAGFPTPISPRPADYVLEKPPHPIRAVAVTDGTHHLEVHLLRAQLEQVSEILDRAEGL